VRIFTTEARRRGEKPLKHGGKEGAGRVRVGYRSKDFLCAKRKKIYSKRAKAMTESDDKQLDRPLSPEEAAQARLLTAADLKRIDECLLSKTSHQWGKVARVIGQTMLVLDREFPGLPDVFYSTRIKHLAKSGAIETAGNLDRIRYSEIRLPDQKLRGQE
jgi:hypothetical protein